MYFLKKQLSRNFYGTLKKYNLNQLNPFLSILIKIFWNQSIY